MGNSEIEIIEPVDSGLYGRIYKGRQVSVDRIVAVKIIKPDWPRAAGALEHAKALARVDGHPNIVTVHMVTMVDVDGIDGLPAVVMEWLDGETLASRLGGDFFSEQEARRICVGVLDGLDHMHSRGIAHGDLHAGNIVLLADATPKIIDIDANKDITLARLSTLSRDAAVNSDLDFCKRVAMLVLGRGQFSAIRLNQLDESLKQACSLVSIRECVRELLDGSDDAPAPAPVPPTPATESPSEIAEKAQDYIEQARPASLRSLLIRHFRDACEALVSPEFPARGDFSSEVFLERVTKYERLVTPLLPGLATTAFWGRASEEPLVQECVESIANIYDEKGDHGGLSSLIDLRNYPSTLVLYAGGLGAFLNLRFETLRTLLKDCQHIEHGRSTRLSSRLFRWKSQSRDAWNKYVFGGANPRYTPVSDRLTDVMTRSLEPLTLLRGTLENQLDLFEYFTGLVESYADGKSTPDRAWGPIGSFVWRQKRRTEEEKPGEHFLKSLSKKAREQMLSAGFFGGEERELTRAVKQYEAFLEVVRSQWGM